jgi:heme oxygenase
MTEAIAGDIIMGKLGLNARLSFFNSYSENTYHMWALFKEVLNKQPSETEASIMEAANNTFLNF